MPNNIIIYGRVNIGEGTVLEDNVILGNRVEGIVTIGQNSLVRSRTVIYSGTKIGKNLRTGVNCFVRENTEIGDDVLLGTNSVVDGNCQIGNQVKIQTNVYITAFTVIEDGVFMGPCSVTTNDKYMIYGVNLRGPVIKRKAKIGANTTILPGVIIGEGCIVGAGSVVTKDVPPYKVVMGIPARIVRDVSKDEIVHETMKTAE